MLFSLTEILHWCVGVVSIYLIIVGTTYYVREMKFRIDFPVAIVILYFLIVYDLVARHGYGFVSSARLTYYATTIFLLTVITVCSVLRCRIYNSPKQTKLMRFTSLILRMTSISSCMITFTLLVQMASQNLIWVIIPNYWRINY